MTLIFQILNYAMSTKLSLTKYFFDFLEIFLLES